MAYKFRDPKLEKLAKANKKKKASKKKSSKKKASKRAKRRAAAPAHFPAALASELGYATPKRKPAKKKPAKRKPAKRKKVLKRKAAKRKPAKKTKAQIHAMRVRQGKRLAALRKAQLAGKKRKKASR